jgi:DNA-binding PadR family transcriptional regulator
MAQTHDSNPAAFIPLKPSVFSILMVLSEGDSHGYGIKKEVESRSNNQVRLEPGTLYRVIGKLLDDGLIGEAGGDPVENEDERRKYYTLLPLGRRVLVAETERLALLIDSARSRKLIDPRRAS